MADPGRSDAQGSGFPEFDRLLQLVRRTRELLTLLGLGALGAAVLVLRFMRPEQLARPEGFRNFVDYLVALRTPTTWTCTPRIHWLAG